MGSIILKTYIGIKENTEMRNSSFCFGVILG